MKYCDDLLHSSKSASDFKVDISVMDHNDNILIEASQVKSMQLVICKFFNIVTAFSAS